MLPDTPQICFGLSEKLDRISFSNLLQLLGRKEFADLLSARLNSKEINQAFDQIALVLRTISVKMNITKIFCKIEKSTLTHRPPSTIKSYNIMSPVRLQKFLAASGICSRRKAEQLILDGRVTLNGETVLILGTKITPDIDKITVDGKLVKEEEQKVYYLLNKPKGYVTTLSDPQGRPVVTDLLHGINERVFPVGRLDFDTEGALLLTNDGDLAQKTLPPQLRNL
nr:S4 domain-containing protein [Desulfotalea psychrophila]